MKSRIIIAKRIKDALDKKGYSGRQLALATGTSPASVTQFLRTEVSGFNPSLDTLDKWLEHLKGELAIYIP